MSVKDVTLTITLMLVAGLLAQLCRLGLLESGLVPPARPGAPAFGDTPRAAAAESAATRV